MSSTPTAVPSVTDSPALVLADEMLTDLGFADLPPEARTDLLAFLRAKLDTAVGTRVASDLTTEESSALDDVIDREDPSAARLHLDQVWPEHATIVREELDRLVEQLRAERPAFLAALGASEESA